MREKINIKLGNVQETLLLPLWGRAVETRKQDALLKDETACEIIEKIDYDFSSLTRKIDEISRMGWVARSLLFDGIIKRFLAENPHAAVVNIGCGFDTTFERVDNGSIRWYDLDLPDVIESRRKFIGESGRRKYIAGSFLEPGRLDGIDGRNGVLLTAAGVFYYFDEAQIKAFFVRAANLFPRCEIVFDATSNINMANKLVVKRAGLGEAVFLKWELRNARKMESWDERIGIAAEYPMFKAIRKTMNLRNKLMAAVSDFFRMQYVVHMKLE